jgi:hypothetical protein
MLLLMFHTYTLIFQLPIMDVRRYKGGAARFFHWHVNYLWWVSGNIPSYKEGCYSWYHLSYNFGIHA